MHGSMYDEDSDSYPEEKSKGKGPDKSKVVSCPIYLNSKV